MKLHFSHHHTVCDQQRVVCIPLLQGGGALQEEQTDKILLIQMNCTGY